MVIIQESKSLHESKMLDADEFIDRLRATCLTEIVLNAGTAVMSASPLGGGRSGKGNSVPSIKNGQLRIYCSDNEILIDLRNIKGVEETQHCFFIKTAKADIWLKF